jgi:hypothetical protein
MGKKTAPVEFGADIAAQVCGLIAAGLSLRKIKMREGMPTKSAILSWLLRGETYKAAGQATNPKALFLDHYAARARSRLTAWRMILSRSPMIETLRTSMQLD